MRWVLVALKIKAQALILVKTKKNGRTQIYSAGWSSISFGYC